MEGIGRETVGAEDTKRVGSLYIEQQVGISMTWSDMLRSLLIVWCIYVKLFTGAMLID